MKHLYSLVFLLFALASSHLTTAQAIIPNVTYTNDNNSTCSGTATAAPTGGAGGYVFMWSNGATTSSISGLCAGSYYVVIQDANQDTASFSFTITNPCSNLVVTPSVTNCTPGNCDGTIQIIVTGGSGPYSFSVGGGPQTGQSLISNLCPGIYMVTVVDANGCSATATATVTDPSLSTITPNLTTVDALGGNCSGSAGVAPTGGSGTYSYLWSTGATTSSINLLCIGNYSVTIYDATDSVTVSFNIFDPCIGFTGNYSNTPASGPGICDGSVTFTPIGGTPPYSYIWNTGVTTQSMSNLCSGNYTAQCVDANGCITTQIFVVTNTGTISINLTTADDLTGNCSGSASVSPTGGSGVYNYQWNTGSTGSSISNLCTGTYSVTVWDSTDTVTVNFNILEPCSNFTGIFSSTPASGPAICDGSIMFNPFNGTAPYTYVWNTGTTTQSNSNLCAGNYTVTCTDFNGCSITATGSVIDTSVTPVPISVNLTTTDDFTNNCSGSASVSPTGGSGVYFIEWSTGETTTSINNLCAGVYSVLTWSTFYWDSTFVSFVITDSSSTYGNNPYPNGTINDTLYTDLVTNCIIDYNAIDSASLYQAVYSSSNQSLYVTWAVYSPTDTVYISDTLALIGNPGYYALTISVYCPNKSGNDFFKIESVIYFDGSNVWMSTLGLDEQHLLDNINVYPNPFTNSISVDNKDGVIQSLKLIDLNGRTLSEMNQVNSGLIELGQLESISSGTYLLILTGENSSKTVKVIK